MESRPPMLSPFLPTEGLVLPTLSPSTGTKLPGLQVAISARRAGLCLPALQSQSAHQVLQAPRYCDRARVMPLPSMMLPMQARTMESPYTEESDEIEETESLQDVEPMQEQEQEQESEPSASPNTDGDDDEQALQLKKKKGTRRGTLNADAKRVLKAWMFSPEHFAHPYPSEEEKEQLAVEAGIDVKQLSNWFTNARKRLWQPVLRKSGVEVKNFLSTGRGGPRGSKLDIPVDLERLILHTPLMTPPTSPSASSDSTASTVCSLSKRKWSEIQSPSTTQDCAEVTVSKKKSKKKNAGSTASRKRSKDSHKKTDKITTSPSDLADDLCNVLMEEDVEMRRPSLPTFPLQDDLELLAAASLLGLHRQYAPVC